ncbi:unnamed protein product [Anisakis simplex]|uniref:RanBP2-type domain-containing protein n=1 Tax=Anisakis simplex TaxID=6269 RepID=A0A158PP86_ANISI|nr:unnamed protein product [Anisakis simplex]
MGEPNSSKNWLSSVISNVSGFVRESLNGSTISGSSPDHPFHNTTAGQQSGPNDDPADSTPTDDHGSFPSNDNSPTLLTPSTQSQDVISSQRPIRYLSPSVFKGQMSTKTASDSAFSVTNTSSQREAPTYITARSATTKRANNTSNTSYRFHETAPSSDSTSSDILRVSASPSSSLSSHPPAQPLNMQSRKRGSVTPAPIDLFGGSSSDAVPGTMIKRTRHMVPSNHSLRNFDRSASRSPSPSGSSTFLRRTPLSQTPSYRAAMPSFRCSSATQRNHSNSSSSVPRSASSVSGLSSRTLEILDELKKISNPLRNIPTWRMSNKPERWATDLLESPVSRPPVSTMNAVPRARIIADSIYATSMNRTEKRWNKLLFEHFFVDVEEDVPQISSVGMEMEQSSASFSPQMSSALFEHQAQKPSAEYVQAEQNTDDNSSAAAAESRSSTSVFSSSVSKKFDDTVTSKKRSNIFSARWPELNVIGREETSTQTVLDQPVTSKSQDPTQNHSEKSSHHSSTFKFSTPIRRGPSKPPKNLDVIVSTFEEQEALPKVSDMTDAEAEKSHEKIKASETQQNVQTNGIKKWTCKTCFISNGADEVKCMACGEAKASTVSGGNTEVAAAASRQSQSCRICFISNPCTATKCMACDTPLHESTTDTASNVFGNRAFKPTNTTSPPGVKFGFGGASGSGSGAQPAFGLGSSSVISDSLAKNRNESINSVNAVASFGLANSSSAPDLGHFTKATAGGVPHLDVIKEEQQRSSLTTNTSADLTSSSSSKNQTAQPNISEPTATISSTSTTPSLQSSSLFGGIASISSPTLTQTSSTPVLPTFDAPTSSNKPASISFGVPTSSFPPQTSESASTANTSQSTNLFKFGAGKEQQSKTPLNFSAVLPQPGGTVSASLTQNPLTLGTTDDRSNKSSLFGTNTEQSNDTDRKIATSPNSIEMISAQESSSTTGIAQQQPIATATQNQPFTFGMIPSQPQTTTTNSLFNFGANPSLATGSGSSGAATTSSGINTNTSSAAGSDASAIGMSMPFQFGSSTASSVAQPFSGAPQSATVPPVPQTFNFGNIPATNGISTGFTFGSSSSTSAPGVFNFSAQQSAHSLVTISAPTASFSFGSSGMVPGAAAEFGTSAATNFFASGTTSSSSTTTTARKMLKARRRK